MLNPWDGHFKAYDMMIFYPEIASLLKSVDRAILIQIIGSRCAYHEEEGTKKYSDARTIADYLFENYWWSSGSLEFFERLLPWLTRESIATHLEELTKQNYIQKRAVVVDAVEKRIFYRVLEPNLRVRLEKFLKNKD